MKVGDLVRVTIESGFTDIGLIMKVRYSLGSEWIYEVRCQESQTECVATEDMLEVISSST